MLLLPLAGESCCEAAMPSRIAGGEPHSHALSRRLNELGGRITSGVAKMTAISVNIA